MTMIPTVDAIQAIWQWKLWFPNRFFTLNASTLTLIATAMKLPVDLSAEDPEVCSQFSPIYRAYMIERTKMIGILFLFTMLANFLPSLGLMDDRELLMNIVALGILLITIAVNIGIQVFTNMLFFYGYILPVLIFALVWPFSVALTVSTSRKRLEHRYKESQRLVSSYQEKRFSTKGLKSYVKKYWMMTETHNPQFVIACSPVSSAFGVMCLYVSLISGLQFVLFVDFVSSGYYCETSDYKRSLKIIFFVQSLGTLVGSIAPIFRCLSSVGHYSLSKEWNKNHLDVFRVEKHWIQKLQQWKRRHAFSHIPGRHFKIVFHSIKIPF
ncbi:hypothetical protein HanPI659440_Chr11g0440121 [Helianthus annuus]|nr:hypothetical protein HanPI659440_Chr11g0440121 [Helianthus annuus]